MSVAKRMIEEEMACFGLEEEGIEPDLVKLLHRVAVDLYPLGHVPRGMYELREQLDLHRLVFVPSGPTTPEGVPMALVDRVERKLVWPLGTDLTLADIVDEHGMQRYRVPAEWPRAH